MIIIFTFGTESDRLKFECIYNNYKRLLFYKAYSILKDRSLAEDAVSEAFIRVYRNLGKIDTGRANMTASFLVTVVRNTSLTILSKRNRHAERAEFFDERDDFDLEEKVIAAEAAEGMLKVIDGLKEEIKAPFLLKYAHGLSHREIGRMLGITENNATVRIHRAKKTISELLVKEGYGNGQ